MTFQRFRGWAGAVGGGRLRIKRSFGEARSFDGTPASDLVSGWLFDPPPSGPVTAVVGITSNVSPTFKLAGVGGAGIGSAWTLAFGWNAASTGSTRLIGGREGDGSEAIAVLVNDNELGVYGFGASGSLGRYVTYAMGSTRAFWVVRFRYPGTSVANGDIEVYKDGVLQTPVVNDNYSGCDASPRDFDLFVEAGGFTDSALGIYQFSLTAGWQNPADYFDGTDPYSFASMTPAPIIALGDDMTLAQWNSGTNLGSLGALTRTGTPDLIAGAPGTVDLATAGGAAITGAATTSLPFASAATGAVQVAGSAMTSLPFGGTATGNVTGAGVEGTATVVLPFAGTAAGGVSVAGQAATSLPFTGAATGAVAIAGAASNVLPFTGAATGTVRVAGSATVALPFAGTAQGAVGDIPVTGQASVVLPFAGAATGAVAVAGQSAVILPFGGVSAGAVAVAGQASVALPFGGSAQGAVIVAGQALVVLPFAALASGAVQVAGQATVAIAFAGFASGTAGEAAPITGFLVGGRRGGAVLNGSTRGRVLNGSKRGLVMGGGA